MERCRDFAHDLGIVRSRLEITKVKAEIAKLLAEKAKLNAEAAKLTREGAWLPAIAMATAIGAVVAVIKLLS